MNGSQIDPLSDFVDQSAEVDRLGTGFDEKAGSTEGRVERPKNFEPENCQE
jgi:hypothetical protein